MAKKKEQFDNDFFDESFYRAGQKGAKRDAMSPFYVFFFARVRKVIKEILGEEKYEKKKKKFKILDIGCGMGVRTTNYINEGFDAYGLDVTKWGKENSWIPKRHYQGDARETSKVVKRKKFDMVIAERCMGYIPKGDALKTIKEMAKTSKKYLIFSIICSDHQNPQASIIGKPGRINIRSKAYWEKKFKLAKLEINEELTKWMIENWDGKGKWDCIYVLEKKEIKKKKKITKVRRNKNDNFGKSI